MIPRELHHCSRRPLWRLISPAMAVFALVATYALVQYHQDNVTLRAEVNGYKSRGCPSRWRGKPFIFSAEERINILRPGTVSLACYYKAGVKS